MTQNWDGHRIFPLKVVTLEVVTERASQKVLYCSGATKKGSSLELEVLQYDLWLQSEWECSGAYLKYLLPQVVQTFWFFCWQHTLSLPQSLVSLEDWMQFLTDKLRSRAPKQIPNPEYFLLEKPQLEPSAAILALRSGPYLVVPYDVVAINDETAVEEDIQEQAGEIEGEEAPTPCDTTV
ncbi:unnamed protein product [Sphagnum troendelagicum]